jgi:glycosyltransferase involved in cell wall biosynthesis
MIRPILHVAAPRPAIHGADAMWQEAEHLAATFQGELLSVYPGTRPSRWVPRPLYGWVHFSQLQRLDQPGRVHHILYAVPYAFPYLRRLRQPIVYSVMAGAQISRIPTWINRRAVWVVSHEREQARLQQAGAQRVHVIRPGLDLHHLATTPPPPARPWTLLYASAPWTRGQFASKGFDLLLAWTQRHPDRRLLLLWRGLHLDALQARVQRLGIAGQVEVINERADIQSLLARCNAVVLLARHAKLVKTWPHSLLEGLAAGRPVVVSDAIAMSDYVQEHGLGAVVRGWNSSALDDALASVQQPEDAELALRRKERIARDFSPAAMCAGYQSAYEAAAAI